MEQAQTSWVAKAGGLPRKVLTWGIAQVKKSYKGLKNRYGPRYTHAMLSVVCLSFFVPIPGSALVGVTLIVVIAEVHRAISRRGGFPRDHRRSGGEGQQDLSGDIPVPIALLSKDAAAIYSRELVMTIKCDVILQWSATPDQLTALGAGLWRWCNHTAGNTGIYQYLDNQALADLIAGKLPASSQSPRPAERGASHFRFRDQVSRDRQAAIANLRREIPAAGVADVLVNGKSWDLID